MLVGLELLDGLVLAWGRTALPTVGTRLMPTRPSVSTNCFSTMPTPSATALASLAWPACTTARSRLSKTGKSSRKQLFAAALLRVVELATGALAEVVEVGGRAKELITDPRDLGLRLFERVDHLGGLVAGSRFGRGGRSATSRPRRILGVVVPRRVALVVRSSWVEAHYSHAAPRAQSSDVPSVERHASERAR